MTDTIRIMPPDAELDELRRRLLELRRNAPPKVATFASWALDHPQELAFNSVRSLADLADVNANTVVRLAQSLGFSGFDPCRRAFQEALRQDRSRYSSRARRIQGTNNADLLDQMQEGARQSLDGVFDAASRERIVAAATLLLNARQAYVIGVRSCFSLAHYLSYSGGMAFRNFVRRSLEPGDIYDLMARAETSDVLVAITMQHYSAETIRAHKLARQRGLSIVAITDSITSPIADGADVVLTPPMNGPQPMPSLIAAFALVEALIATMISRSDNARGNIDQFERSLLDCGAYIVDQPA